MVAMVWIGGALAALGLAGLAGVVVLAARAKRRGDFAAAAPKLVALNMASVALAFLGLGALAAGLIL